MPLKRFIPGVNWYDNPMMYEHDNGEYVKFEDVVGLLDEVRELLASVLIGFAEKRIEKAMDILDKGIG